jgi:hypothetical protein
MMSEIVHRKSHYTSSWGDPVAMERRLTRTMCWTVVAAVALSAAFAPWRVTTGLLLGGALSLFNHHWLRASIAAAFSTTSLEGLRPRISVARYVLRYFIVAAAVAAAYALNVASVVAMLAGLCTFVVAVMLEAFIQTYFAIIHREEN